MPNYRLLSRSASAFLATLIALNAASAQQSANERLNQAKAAAERIRADDILRDVSYIASDANMGRRTPFPGLPSPGYDSAAAYVAKFLSEMRIKPMGDNGTYFQHYTVTRTKLDTTKVSGAVGKNRLVWSDNFLINGFLLPGVREWRTGHRHGGK